jgi:hypothetical protein
MSESYHESKLDLLAFSSEMVRFVSKKHPALKKAAVGATSFPIFIFCVR